MKAILFFILAIICRLSIGQTDTLVLNQKQLDSLVMKSNYSGVVELFPNRHAFYNPVDPPEAKFLYYNFSGGALSYVDLITYYRNETGEITVNPSFTHLNIEDKPGVYYETRYTIDGQYTEVSKTEVKNDTAYTYSVYYSDDGKLIKHGNYVNGMEHGKWPTKYYCDSIKVTEVWTYGKLTNILSDRIMFIGEKNKVISREEYFEIIESQDGVGWNLVTFPNEWMGNEYKIAFVMYSEKHDFRKLYDKKAEDNEWAQILLKRYGKYQKGL